MLATLLKNDLINVWKCHWTAFLTCYYHPELCANKQQNRLSPVWCHACNHPLYVLIMTFYPKYTAYYPKYLKTQMRTNLNGLLIAVWSTCWVESLSWRKDNSIKITTQKIMIWAFSFILAKKGSKTANDTQPVSGTNPVGLLGPSLYTSWVHAPIFVKNSYPVHKYYFCTRAAYSQIW